MRSFRPYDLDQPYLLPPDLRSWLPGDHLALFLSDVIDSLDLSAILSVYERGDGRGYPPYHPVMMVKLLVYGYCTGKRSSRKLEKATWEEVPYRVLSGNQQPDHATLAEFRRRHLKALSGLFIQVLKLCQKAGLVKLGHIALDGSKLKANASKHKAMSYRRMVEVEATLKKEVVALLTEAEQIDRAEDKQHGKARRGDVLPNELARRESRLKKIQAAKEALETEARAQARAKAEVAKERIQERKRQEAATGKKIGGNPPHVPDPATAVPDAKAQKNFTDPESRIMRDGASKSFQQSYNAQLAVDEASQIIVAASVTQDAIDHRQLVPVLVQVRKNAGRLPDRVSADNGYLSEKGITDPQLADTDLYVAVGRERKAQSHGAVVVESCEGKSAVDEMRKKLSSSEGRDIYRRRKAIVEPVFGQIKHNRGFRQFSFRGLDKVNAEWDLTALTHNLLKLYGSGWKPQLKTEPTTAIRQASQRPEIQNTRGSFLAGREPLTRLSINVAEGHTADYRTPVSGLQPGGFRTLVRQPPRSL